MRNSEKSRRIKTLICMLLIVCVLVLPGCRESTALVQVIHDQKASEVDRSTDQKIVNNKENTGNNDDHLAKLQPDNDSKKKEQKKKLASARAEERNTGQTDRKTYSEDSPNDDGSADDAPDDNQKKEKDKGDGDKNKDKDKNKDDGKDDDGEKEGDEGTKGPSEKGREVYDDDGKVVELPEKVNSVVAADDAGIIAQMLGGKNILTGTSSSVKGNSMAMKIFADKGISKAVTYWNNTGDSPMSSGSFNELLKKKPDCCIAVSGRHSFSNSQIAKLKEKKIAYVTISSMNTADGIDKAVSTVGEVIGNRTAKGGNNARKMAKNYSRYCAKLVKKVKSAAGGLFTYNNTDYNNDYTKNGYRSATSRNRNGKYTLYISGWDSGRFSLSAAGKTVFTANGYPVAPNGYSRSPMSYYMSVGGVCNYAANLGESRCTTYAAIPVVINNLTPSVTGSTGYYRQRNESFASVNMGDDDRINLGNSKYDSIVTDSNRTAGKVKNSYMWKYHGKATLDSITDYGFISEDGSTLIHSYIEDNYNIYVNPSGVLPWTEGSVESVLEAPWAAYRINGGYSESAFKADVREFYSTFYGYDLSGAELSGIISGK